MKKSLPILILLFLVVAASYAQGNFGLTVSGGFSNIDHPYNYFARYGDETKSPKAVQHFTEPTLAWQGGIYYEMPMKHPNLSLITSLIYKKMGANSPRLVLPIRMGDNYYTKPSRFIDYHYVAMEAQANYAFGQNAYVLLGLSPSIYVGEELPFGPQSYKPSRFDLGASLGLGFQVYPRLAIELKGYHSLVNVSEKIPHDDVRTAIYHSAVMLGLRFAMKK